MIRHKVVTDGDLRGVHTCNRTGYMQCSDDNDNNNKVSNIDFRPLVTYLLVMDVLKYRYVYIILTFLN